jgi:hypothetical protein
MQVARAMGPCGHRAAAGPPPAPGPAQAAGQAAAVGSLAGPRAAAAGPGLSLTVSPSGIICNLDHSNKGSNTVQL